jgi:hypothetical protein
VGVDLHEQAGEEAERFRGNRIDVDNGDRIELVDEIIISVGLLGHSASSGLGGFWRGIAWYARQPIAGKRPGVAGDYTAGGFGAEGPQGAPLR